MLKNILNYLRSLYREKVQDTTREWEEVGESKTGPEPSRYAVLVSAPLFERLKFLFTGQMVYRLTKFQANIIRRVT